MFTGIIESRGEVTGITHRGSFIRMTIRTDMDLSDVKEGDSIAVDGACLTVTMPTRGADGFAADVSPETMRVTTLGERKPGAWVNLEKALRLGDRVGGHLVAGHVDCIGRIVEKQQSGPGYAVGCQASSGRYLIAKGSVCVDGVSLTVNEVHGSRFRVMIIPHTAGLTGLTEKRIGDNVNIEYDLVGKYIEKFVTASGADRGVTESVLREHGFM